MFKDEAYHPYRLRYSFRNPFTLISDNLIKIISKFGKIVIIYQKKKL
ncbi:MAG: hypothetical protein LBH59_04505 [Planctomycetaceae bacterium]|nr:hypothetical protein [Planctomycetaceae bacterium]